MSRYDSEQDYVEQVAKAVDDAHRAYNKRLGRPSPSLDLAALIRAGHDSTKFGRAQSEFSKAFARIAEEERALVAAGKCVICRQSAHPSWQHVDY